MCYNGADLVFPHLNIVINNMHNHITVFGYDITFYGMVIGIGVLLGLLLMEKDAKRRGIDPDIFYEFVIYALIFGIIGARIYYVAFEWDYYKGDILSMINIRGGGLAIYGGIIGGVLTAIVFCKVKKISFFRLLDTTVLGLLVGQIMGRWGNFFNCEAFGGYTDSLFAMRIREAIVSPSMISKEVLAHEIIDNGIAYIQVMPTFLYESFWNLLVLIFLLLYGKKQQQFRGEIMVLYFMLYGLGRFFIEGLRTDSLMIPNTNIAVSQALSAVLFVTMLIWFIIAKVQHKGEKKPLL